MKNKQVLFFLISLILLLISSCGNSYRHFEKYEIRMNEDKILEKVYQGLWDSEEKYGHIRDFGYAMILNLEDETINDSILNDNNINFETGEYSGSDDHFSGNVNMSEIRKMLKNNIPIVELTIHYTQPQDFDSPLNYITTSGQNITNDYYKTYTCFFPDMKNPGDFCYGMGTMYYFEGYFPCFKYFPHYISIQLKDSIYLVKNSNNFRMPKIQYALGSADLLPESKDSLNYLFDILTKNPDIICELDAHTDIQGDSASNYFLSEARAKSCVDYLVEVKGISKNRLISKGFGQTKLLVNTDLIKKSKSKKEKETLHQKNRRTEFKVLNTNYFYKKTKLSSYYEDKLKPWSNVNLYSGRSWFKNNQERDLSKSITGIKKALNVLKEIRELKEIKEEVSRAYQTSIRTQALVSDSIARADSIKISIDKKIGPKLFLKLDKKNLNVSKYRNGDDIPQVKNASAWANLTTGAWCYYENKTANGTKYGKLYNWYAINDPRGLAPKGYHIPTDKEWKTLINSLGGDSIAGKKMKSTSGWRKSFNGTNSSGFTALPGGFREGEDGYFGYGQKYLGLGEVLVEARLYIAGWWSSSEGNYSAFGAEYGANVFLMQASSNFMDMYINDKRNGYSVRCIRD